MNGKQPIGERKPQTNNKPPKNINRILNLKAGSQKLDIVPTSMSELRKVDIYKKRVNTHNVYEPRRHKAVEKIPNKWSLANMPKINKSVFGQVPFWTKN